VDTTTATSPAIPQFAADFGTLVQQLGPLMGIPLEAEHGAPDSCDTQQHTTTGLAYWRCGTNVASFVDADGAFHWAWVGQLVSWQGDSPDPPQDAVALAAADTQGNACFIVPSDDSICPLSDGMSVVGYISEAGQTNIYHFDVGDASMHITVDLSQLPADYDLYLADGAGDVLDGSAQEGLSPEEVDDLLPPGSYYLFVHSDPGRAIDPTNPYSLHLSIAPTTTTAAAAP
jgi:hypothetical protein